MTRVRPPGSRLRVRLVAASAVLSLLVTALATAALLGVLHGEFDREVHGRLIDRADALTATVSMQSGRVDVTGADDALFDAPNWVFDARGRQIEGQRRSGALTAAVRSLARTRTPAERIAPGWRVRAVPVVLGSSVIAVAVTAVDRRPYEASLAAVARAAVVLGLLTVLGATALAAVVLSRGLGPIAAMTQQAATWSRAHSHRRFALGAPRDEVTRLAAVLDELLDRVEDALESERRLTAEIAHELRTPLTALRGEADLALMSPATPVAVVPRFERIRDAAMTMSAAMTALLDVERAGGGAQASTPALQAVAALVEALPPHPGATVTVLGDRAVRTAVPGDLLRQIVAPLLDNALTAAAGAVHVEVEAATGRVAITVRDDGPGVDPALRSTLFTAGTSGRTGGTGLGLGIARRLAAASGGTLELEAARPATFRVRLPAADHVR